MKFSLITALSLAVAPVLAVPPESFGFPSAPNDTQLTVAFRQNSTLLGYIPLQPGELFGINVPESRPVLGVNTSAYSSLANYTGNYLVLMVDPDASTPQAPTSRFILHWLVPNLTQTGQVVISDNLTFIGRRLVNASQPIVTYARPRPPTNSSAHRYILYAFAQPANFSLPPQWQGLSDANRTRFNLTNFIRDTNLGTPLAANYFYCSNQTGIPSNFTAAAGGQYPIGNGQLITSGTVAPTSSASLTGAAASSMVTMGSTMTGSSVTTAGASSSTSRAGAAAMVTGMSGLVGAGLMGLAALL